MKIKETALWLQSHNRYLILTHRRPDGDTIGCAAALACGLRELGKTAYILENPDTTKRYSGYVQPYLAPNNFTPDHIISVDVANKNMFPAGSESYTHAIDLSIDHHPSNSRYAKHTCVDGSCAACGEIICDILLELTGKLSAETATAIYTAVSTDTGCFAFANTTANTFRIAALTASAGAPIATLNKKLFRTKPRGRIALEGMIISGMEFYNGGRTAVITITQEMMTRVGVTENDMDDIASIPGIVEGVDVGITIRELDKQSVKISVRTTQAVDANRLCSFLGGGGHAMAAGCTLTGTPEEAKSAILSALNGLLADEG
jgi:phosphoesterase RecJ-like protein